LEVFLKGEKIWFFSPRLLLLSSWDGAVSLAAGQPSPCRSGRGEEALVVVVVAEEEEEEEEEEAER